MDPSSYNSPFEPSLRPHLASLPVVFRDELLHGPDEPFDIVLVGTMDRVWHRPRWLWPLLWMMHFTGPLFPETGRGVPSRVLIAARRGDDGQPRQEWRRAFRFGKQRRSLNTVAEYLPDVGAVVEWFPPAGLLGIASAVDLDADGALTLSTPAMLVRLGPWQFGLPAWLWRTVLPAPITVQRPVPGTDDTFVMRTELRHRLLGPVFGYEGTFRVQKRPRS